jgi:hypothetical protein
LLPIDLSVGLAIGIKAIVFAAFPGGFHFGPHNVGWGAQGFIVNFSNFDIEISEASVSKYMIRHPKPPSQTWRTFLNNQAIPVIESHHCGFQVD